MKLLKMKKYKCLILILIVVVLKTMAQEKEAYTYGDKMGYEHLKSIFKKPNYEWKVQKYEIKELLPAIRLSETDKSVVLDSLQKSATLTLESDPKGLGLNMELKFPEAYNSPNKVVSTFNSNDNILSKTVKLELAGSQLFNSANQRLKVRTTLNSISFGKRTSPALNGKSGRRKVNANYVSMFNFINDSVPADSMIKGSATYNIKIITAYDSVRCNKKDISKIIKLKGATYRIVSIMDNKVVLAILQGKRVDNELRVVSFDSIGKSVIQHAKFKNFLYASSDSTAQNRYFVVDKQLYDLIRQHPQMTVDEYRKAMTDISKTETRQKYIVLETTSPLTNDFLIYSPIYGVEKQLELKLRH
jgi:hypothetical protein